MSELNPFITMIGSAFAALFAWQVAGIPIVAIIILIFALNIFIGLWRKNQ